MKPRLNHYRPEHPKGKGSAFAPAKMLDAKARPATPGAGLVPSHGEPGGRGFSRVDLVVTAGVVVFLAVWFGFEHLGERGRTRQCAGNLRALGQAMQGYAEEHGGGLPAAGIDLPVASISWDSLVGQYLHQSSVNKMARFLACPSDSAPHGATPRSYAMSGNDMALGHWPPGPESATGVGLWWDKDSVLTLVNQEALQKLELLPVLKLSAVPAPAGTVLLTDSVDSDNTLGSTRQTRVFDFSQQRHFFADDGAQFHRGGFNYLMVDGHVEWLSPLQTIGIGGPAGIWSLKKGN